MRVIYFNMFCEKRKLYRQTTYNLAENQQRVDLLLKISKKCIIQNYFGLSRGLRMSDGNRYISFRVLLLRL